MFQSVVLRTRIFAGLLLLVVVGLFVSSSVSLRKIKDEQHVVTRDAIPSILEAESLSRRLSDLLLELEKIRLDEQLSAGEAVANRVNDMISVMLEDPDLAPEIIDLLGRLQISARANISESLRLNGLKRAQSAIADQLGEISIRGRQLIEPAISAAVLNIERSVDYRPDNSVDQARKFHLSGALSQLLHLSQVHFDLRGLIELMQQTPVATDPAELTRIATRFSFELAKLTRHLAAITSDEIRLEVSSELRHMVEMVQGNDGMLALQRTRLAKRAELKAESDIQAGVVKQIISFTQQQSDAAKGKILIARHQLEETSRQMFLIQRISGFATIALTLIVAFLVIERQLIARLRLLTQSVSRIAEGDTDHTVAVTGRDELGQMARALEVFKENSRELLRSNEELSRFAYAAAHDLRSPVRAIQDLAVWTIQDSGNELPDIAKDYLEKLIVRTDRLTALLSALLDYAQLGREQASVDQFSIEEMAESVFDLISPEKKFVLDVQTDEPTIKTYEAPLRQILMNLFVNAIKHHDRDEGRITVKLAFGEKRVTISVSDDGPGVPKTYHDRIFNLFQTLRPRDEVEGSGMGLSIIRKLVEHYNGQIRIISDPDECRGATFEFDWPLVTINHGVMALSDK